MSNFTSEINMKIPVPYGHLHAKVWGSPGPNKLKVLAIHGWQDNAGSWDKLIPFLNYEEHLYVVAFDMTGHGLSSHLPQGVCYSEITFLLDIKRVLDYLKWNKVTIMAHSMGANISLQFAATYPDLVERIVTIDTVKSRICSSDVTASMYAQHIDKYLQVEKRTLNNHIKEPSFSYDMAIKIMISAHESIGRINREGASCLLKRSTKIIKNDGQTNYVFTRDNRLNSLVFKLYDAEMMKLHLSSIKCELLIILGTNGLGLEKEYDNDFYDLYKSKCKSFDVVYVNGDHYIHLTNPKEVAPHINQFFNEAISELQSNY